MINIALGATLIAVLLSVFYQDAKDRMAYWFLYPLAGILCYAIQSRYIGWLPSLVNSFINLCLIAIVLFVGAAYSRIVMKRKFVNESMGMGDLLLFLFLCFAFTPLTFIILFVFSLCFSLLLHLYLKKRSNHTTVPLAGYVSLFFSVVYLVSFCIEPKYLFA